jgi:hypothetical protein
VPTVHDWWWGRAARVAAGRYRDPHEKTAGPGLARVGRRPAATATGHELPLGYRHHHRTSGTGSCSARCDRDPPDVAHTWAARCMSAAGRGRRGQSRRTSGTNACLARCNRHAQGAAHAGAAMRTSTPPAVAGRGSRVARAARERARLAAIATCSMRHTRGPSSVHPAAGRGRRGRSRRTSGTETLLGLLRSRRAECGTHVGRPAHLLRRLRQAGAVASRERARGRAGLVAIASRRMLRTRGLLCPHPTTGSGRRVRSRRTSGTGTCSARCVRDARCTGCGTRVATGLTTRRRPWRAGAVMSRRRHGDVLRSRRSRCAGCGTHLGRPAHIPTARRGRRR